jgi:hypothetical protein
MFVYSSDSSVSRIIKTVPMTTHLEIVRKLEPRFGRDDLLELIAESEYVRE